MVQKKLTAAHRIRRKLRNRDSSFHPSKPTYKWWLLANVMIGTFMAVLDSTIVNVGLPKIMASFGVGIDKIEWVITAYMLALAVMLPTAAWLADKFGYKRMYFFGMAMFTFGSFLCGISGNENMLIFSRVVQGLGGGMLMPLGMAIISREFPPEQRGTALGFWAIAAAASVSFGPLIGGYLVDNFSWQLIFDVNVPIGIIGLLTTIIIQSEYKNKRMKKFDLIGFLSVSTFLPVILYALTESAATTNTEGWSSPVVIACIIISIIALAVFLTTELTIDNPLMDLKLFLNYNFAICSVMMLVFGIGMFGSTFLLPVYLQNSLNYTALQAGAVFLPVGILQGAISPLSGLLGDRTNAKIPITLGIVLMAFSFYLNSKLSFLSEHNFIMLSLYLRGFGMGLMFTPLSSIALLEIPREKMAQASGLFNIVRQLGGSFGVAILATLLTVRLNYHQQIYSQSIDMNSPQVKNITYKMGRFMQHTAGVSTFDARKLSQTALIGQINKEATIQAIDDDFLIASIITLVGMFPVFLLHTKRKEKKKDNEYTHQLE
jgi:MFS transporter, DHA2 family, multidrug resistance protein